MTEGWGGGGKPKEEDLIFARSIGPLKLWACSYQHPVTGMTFSIKLYATDEDHIADTGLPFFRVDGRLDGETP